MSVLENPCLRLATSGGGGRVWRIPPEERPPRRGENRPPFINIPHTDDKTHVHQSQEIIKQGPGRTTCSPVRFLNLYQTKNARACAAYSMNSKVPSSHQFVARSGAQKLHQTAIFFSGWSASEKNVANTIKNGPERMKNALN